MSESDIVKYILIKDFIYILDGYSCLYWNDLVYMSPIIYHYPINKLYNHYIMYHREKKKNNIINRLTDEYGYNLKNKFAQIGGWGEYIADIEKTISAPQIGGWGGSDRIIPGNPSNISDRAKYSHVKKMYIRLLQSD